MHFYVICTVYMFSVQLYCVLCTVCTGESSTSVKLHFFIITNLYKQLYINTLLCYMPLESEPCTVVLLYCCTVVL